MIRTSLTQLSRPLITTAKRHKISMNIWDTVKIMPCPYPPKPVPKEIEFPPHFSFFNKTYMMRKEPPSLFGKILLGSFLFITFVYVGLGRSKFLQVMDHFPGFTAAYRYKKSSEAARAEKKKLRLQQEEDKYIDSMMKQLKPGLPVRADT
eukprot:TRINITY_DN851_c0_g1_i1.p1 TRINITY_DN851_c0_g1~~TRINITY_DN851_c0_g1_i1.p1  ORF type:complete len:150 (-),score=22.89 TRINITY_DN851_c0_g1_i1:144-593(-)